MSSEMGNPDRHLPVEAQHVKNQLARVNTRIATDDPAFDSEVQSSLDVAVEFTKKYVDDLSKVTPGLHNAIVILAAAIFNRREIPQLYWGLIASSKEQKAA